MDIDVDPKEALRKSRELVDRLKSHLPKDVDGLSLSPKSKLPFKAMSIRDLLYLRFAELTDVAVNQFETNKLVAAHILTRSSLETFAMLYYLYIKMMRVVETQTVGDIDQIMMRMLFGCKDGKLELEAINILTAIDHFDKNAAQGKKILRYFYDTLSESSHPNWFGTYAAYGILDEQNYCLKLVSNKNNDNVYQYGILALLTTLEGFYLYYDQINEIRESFIKICDNNIKKE